MTDERLSFVNAKDEAGAWGIHVVRAGELIERWTPEHAAAIAASLSTKARLCLTPGELPSP